MTSRTIMLFMFFCIGPSYAQVGSLDVSFSNDGKLMTPLGGSNDIAYGVAVQGDHRIVTVGSTRQGADDDFAIVRYLEDGSLDLSFSGDGIVYIDFDGGDDVARDVLILSDGNILIGGTAKMGADFDFALALLNQDGELISSFGDNGLVTCDFSNTNDVFSRMAVHVDRIYAVGSTIESGLEAMAVAAFRLNGTPEETFSQDGKKFLHISAGGDLATSLVIQPDDKIVVAGHTGFNFEKDFCVLRFNPDGSLDNSFADDGILILDVGPTHDRAFAVAMQSDQRIIVAGTSYVDTGDDFAVIRLLTDGQIDTDFGEGGSAIVGIGPFYDEVNDMILQPDDKILVAGYAGQTATDADFGLARFTADGLLDQTFGQNGKVITIIGNGQSEDEAHAIALQPDGKILLVGEAENTSNNLDFALTRYFSGLPTSIEEGVISLKELTLHPNPTLSFLQAIFYLAKEELLSFSIFDFNGKNLGVVKGESHYREGDHTVSLNLPASLSSGIYVLKVTNGSGISRGYPFFKR